MRGTTNVPVFLGFSARPDELGGGNRANLVCGEVLRANFRITDDLEDAGLQVRSHTWDAPGSPRRLFVDHGSFADAGFWTYVAPKLRSSDAILVSSRVCARVADRFFDGAGPHIGVVPFTVDLERFRPATDRRTVRQALCDQHGIPADGPLLLMAAAFVRRKNHHLAVRFLGSLLRKVPDARLAIVGATPERATSLAYRTAVQKVVADEGLSARVHLLGAVPQAALALLMSGAGFLLHLTTCRLENFGLVVAEAMAAGLPVLASDWGGVRDLVLPGRTGLLAPTFLTDRGPRCDWRSIVEPAAALLRDREAWSEMSRAARRQAMTELSHTVYEQRLCSALRTALERPQSADAAPRFSAPARELAFRTMTLNATHPEISDAGDEFRLLMPLDGGAHYRFLAGPAASRERPAILTPEDRLYADAPWVEHGDEIESLDPVWPGRMAIEPLALDVLRQSDGDTRLHEIARTSKAQPSDPVHVVRAAQWLVDHGLLTAISASA